MVDMHTAVGRTPNFMCSSHLLIHLNRAITFSLILVYLLKDIYPVLVSTIAHIKTVKFPIQYD